MNPSKYLFVCTANRLRSRTGEDVFLELGLDARSAGTMVVAINRRCCKMGLYVRFDETCPLCGKEGDVLANEYGEKQLTAEMLAWADKVYVMGSDHVEFIQVEFPEFSGKVINLKIPDVYERGHPLLVAKFRVLAKEEGADV